MSVNYISLAFVTYSDADLDATVEKVNTKMTANPNFLLPDPTLAEIMTSLGTFMTCVTAMHQGGSLATIARDNARAALIVLLRSLVAYIEKTCANDPVKLLSSGFDITNSDHLPVVLTKPAIAGIDFGAPGTVILHCGSMGNAKFLKIQYRLVGGVWVDGLVSSQARNIIVPGLVSGSQYEFRVQAGAGFNNFSEWSDPVGHMAG